MREGVIDRGPLIDLLRQFFIASAVTCIFYVLFYHYSHAIWTLNMVKPSPEFTPWIRPWILEHDGIEVYILYAMMFGAIAVVALFNYIFIKIDRKTIKNIAYFFIVLFSFYFYSQIWFNPPLPASKLWPEGLFFMAATGLISFVLVKYGQKNKWWLLVFCLLLLSLCLISTEWISLHDYTYVLTPALRAAHGYKLSESYCQYDYLLSLLALFWLKLNLSAYSFHRLAAVSYFILLAGIWFFAKRFLRDKRLAIYLVIILAIIKLYGNVHDPVYIIQVTPLRLDWWLAVLGCAYWKGIQHWLVGLLLGFLIIFHNVFGLIYAFSYILLILFLAFTESGNNIPFVNVVKKYCGLYVKNLIIIITSMVFYQLFFKPEVGTTAMVYQKYGIGFLPISRTSFYWYMPVITSLIFLLVLRNRIVVSEKYFPISIFLILLAIGNSLYFFGRSHEHNIINIASSLVLCLFVLFDLVNIEINKNTYAKINSFFIPILSFMLLLGVGYTYSDRAVKRIKQQYYVCLKKNQTVNHLLPDHVIGEVKALTSNSSKIIFLTWFDFPFYYEGGYIPQHYYCFTYSWVFSKDYIDFLNTQLAKGYYVVMPTKESSKFEDIMVNLKYKRKVTSNNFVVINTL